MSTMTWAQQGGLCKGWHLLRRHKLMHFPDGNTVPFVIDFFVCEKTGWHLLWKPRFVSGVPIPTMWGTVMSGLWPRYFPGDN